MPFVVIFPGQLTLHPSYPAILVSLKHTLISTPTSNSYTWSYKLQYLSKATGQITRGFINSKTPQVVHRCPGGVCKIL
jgi:hypothetical protein